MNEVIKSIIKKAPKIEFGPELSAGSLAGNRLLIKQWDVEEKTRSGIIIPDTVKDEARPKWGTVVCVGKGSEEEPQRYAVGQTVIFGKYAGTEIIIDNQEYVFLSHHDVFMSWPLGTFQYEEVK